MYHGSATSRAPVNFCVSSWPTNKHLVYFIWLSVRPRFLSCSGYLRNPCRSDNQNTDSHPLSSGAPGVEQAECFLRIIYFLCRSAAGCRSPHGWSQRSRSRTGCRGAAGGPRWVRTLSAMVLRQMLPWQMKHTLIIILFLLVLPRNALFARFSGIRVVCSEITDCGKSEQD